MEETFAKTINDSLPEKNESKSLTDWQWFLIIFFCPLVVGTIGRSLIFLLEHIDEIWNWLATITRSLVQYFYHLMETNIIAYLLLTSIVNWLFGALIIIGFAVLISET